MVGLLADNLLAAAVGFTMGLVFGLGFAAVALGSAGSAWRRLVAGSLALALSTVGGMWGGVLGFETVWNITRDVSLAGIGATVGALALSIASGGLVIVKMVRIA